MLSFRGSMREGSGCRQVLSRIRFLGASGVFGTRFLVRSRVNSTRRAYKRLLALLSPLQLGYLKKSHSPFSVLYYAR